MRLPFPPTTASSTGDGGSDASARGSVSEVSSAARDETAAEPGSCSEGAFGAPAATCEYSAAASDFFRGRGTLACLYSCSASQVVQRVCLTSGPTIATT